MSTSASLALSAICVGDRRRGRRASAATDRRVAVVTSKSLVMLIPPLGTNRAPDAGVVAAAAAGPAGSGPASVGALRSDGSRPCAIAETSMRRPVSGSTWAAVRSATCASPRRIASRIVLARVSGVLLIACWVSRRSTMAPPAAISTVTLRSVELARDPQLLERGPDLVVLRDLSAAALALRRQRAHHVLGCGHGRCLSLGPRSLIGRRSAQRSQVGGSRRRPRRRRRRSVGGRGAAAVVRPARAARQLPLVLGIEAGVPLGPGAVRARRDPVGGAAARGRRRAAADRVEAVEHAVARRLGAGHRVRATTSCITRIASRTRPASAPSSGRQAHSSPLTALTARR